MSEKKQNAALFYINISYYFYFCLKYYFICYKITFFIFYLVKKLKRQKMVAVGFEPTPSRTSALNWRLRPLGQTTLC